MAVGEAGTSHSRVGFFSPTLLPTKQILGKVLGFLLVLSKFTPVLHLCAVASKDWGVTPRICSALSHVSAELSPGAAGAREAVPAGRSCTELCCPPVPAAACGGTAEDAAWQHPGKARLPRHASGQLLGKEMGEERTPLGRLTQKCAALTFLMKKF